MIDAASISQFTQANVAAEVNMKVAVKTKDIAKQQGAAAISLLEKAAQLSKSLATESGKDRRLDVAG